MDEWSAGKDLNLMHLKTSYKDGVIWDGGFRLKRFRLARVYSTEGLVELRQEPVIVILHKVYKKDNNMTWKNT